MKQPQWQDFTLEFLFTKWTLGSCFALAFIIFSIKIALLILRKIDTLLLKYHPTTIFNKYFLGVGQ